MVQEVCHICNKKGHFAKYYRNKIAKESFKKKDIKDGQLLESKEGKVEGRVKAKGSRQGS